jgi:hypothetical protein
MAGGDLSGVNSAVGDKLVSMGLAIKYNDGTYQLSGAGKSAIAAAAKGDKLKTAAALALAKTRKSGVVRPTKPYGGEETSGGDRYTETCQGANREAHGRA